MTIEGKAVSEQRAWRGGRITPADACDATSYTTGIARGHAAMDACDVRYASKREGVSSAGVAGCVLDGGRTTGAASYSSLT